VEAEARMHVAAGVIADAAVASSHSPNGHAGFDLRIMLALGDFCHEPFAHCRRRRVRSREGGKVCGKVYVDMRK
jgi:hypothetical protein